MFSNTKTSETKNITGWFDFDDYKDDEPPKPLTQKEKNECKQWLNELNNQSTVPCFEMLANGEMKQLAPLEKLIIEGLNDGS